MDDEWREIAWLRVTVGPGINPAGLIGLRRVSNSRSLNHSTGRAPLVRREASHLAITKYGLLRSRLSRTTRSARRTRAKFALPPETEGSVDLILRFAARFSQPADPIIERRTEIMDNIISNVSRDVPFRINFRKSICLI